MNVGAPAGGMNSAGRAAVRLAQYEGHTVLGIKDGFEGLLADKVSYNVVVDVWYFKFTRPKKECLKVSIRILAYGK